MSYVPIVLPLIVAALIAVPLWRFATMPARAAGRLLRVPLSGLGITAALLLLFWLGASADESRHAAPRRAAPAPAAAVAAVPRPPAAVGPAADYGKGDAELRALLK
jgi:hypothetical protein